MKKFFSILITLCLCISVSFAEFDPYADEEPEGKPTKKLIYGIALTLIGGVLTYDGFSQVEEDFSKPSVDYATVLHSEWDQNVGGGANYTLRSGISPYPYTPDGTKINIERNILYNNGNVDLYNVTIEVRYKYGVGGGSTSGQVIIDNNVSEHPYNGTATSDGYHVATYYSAYDIGTRSSPTASITGTEDPATGATKTECTNINLKKGEAYTWEDLWKYSSANTSPPNNNQRTIDDDDDNPKGLNLGENALDLMDVRVVLNKNSQYKPLIRKRNKSDIEGVCGILMCAAGIYFIIDYFVDMHKFNVYAKKHQLNMKIATAPNEYKLLLQKRI